MPSRRWFLALLLAAAAAAGCAGPPAPPSLTRIAVVVAPTPSQPQPVLTAADRELLASAARTDAATFHLLVAGATAADRQVDLTPLRELPGGQTEIEYGPRREVLIGATIDGIAGALNELAPADGVPDLLGAIGDAAALGPAGTMLVKDSGLTTADPTDLVELGWDLAPATIVDDLRARGLVPDLTGWEVRFSGLGRVMGEQGEPALPQQRWLAELWLGICAAGGAAACSVEPVAETPEPPRATRAVPLVPIPDSPTMQRTEDDVIVATLPASSLGFTEGSAELPVDADVALADVLAVARAGGHRIQVDGYVAHWGSEQYRAELSEDRAAAVAARLVALGVPADLVGTAGLGAADGPDASMTSGHFDEVKVRSAGIRRVVVTLTPRSLP